MDRLEVICHIRIDLAKWAVGALYQAIPEEAIEETVQSVRALKIS
jgi:hypothetical protein